MLKIGKVKLTSNLILAPLSGISDLPFRMMAREFGCKFAFYEMMDCHGILHSHKKTLGLLKSTPDDSPVGAQILGNDPEEVLEACQIILENSDSKIIDLNCACPAKKVIKKHCGSYMLKDPKKTAKVIKKMADSLPIPITVKIRSGFVKDDSGQGLALAMAAQDSGAKAVFIHGRTALQGYSGRVNYESIAEVKKALKIPVFGSGDVLSPELAKRMLDRTCCDGVLVARGAMGSPWIFKQTEEYLKLEEMPSEITQPSYEEIINAANKHLKAYKDYKDGSSAGVSTAEKYYLGHLRKIAMWYTKGLPYSKKARGDICKAASYSAITNIIEKLKHDYDKAWLKK